jgi:hypothetical protein
MGHVWVVDADLKSYFDTIPHDRLLALVTERVADGRVLALVERFQQAGVLEEAKGWQPTARGTPQGGVISPLLANLYLHPLDHQMEKAGWEMVRYADTPIEGRFTESFHDSRIAHRGHEPAQRRSADSLVRELVEVGSRGQSCPRSGQRFMESLHVQLRTRIGTMNGDRSAALRCGAKGLYSNAPHRSAALQFMERVGNRRSRQESGLPPRLAWRDS